MRVPGPPVKPTLARPPTRRQTNAVNTARTASGAAVTGALHLWAARVAWLALPLLVGTALTEALGEVGGGVRIAAALLAWGSWLAGLIALLVPSTVSLTTARVLAPATPAVAAWTATGAEAWKVGLALTGAALAAGLVFLPEVGQRLVQGSSYGDESRYPLRVPGTLLLGPLPLFWAVLVAGAVSGPLLLGAEAWVAGGIAVAAGWPVAFLLARRLHRLSRRFVVFVPAGVVLHDHVALADTAMFRTPTVVLLQAAPADTTATDCTAGALGLALELRLKDPSPVTLAGTPSDRGGKGVVTDQVLFTPTRPGAVLAEAARRRIRTA
jgi:hypothetical protein